MTTSYIVPDWLEAVRSTTLFYPAAGEDYAEPLAALRDYVDSYWFCDPYYPKGLDRPPVLTSHSDVRLVKRIALGATSAEMELRTSDSGMTYRYLQPSLCSEVYERADGRSLTVTLRRRFGQISLNSDFTERSIGVFMHRGDSPGESGSNVYFLANKNLRHELCGRLLDRLCRRLTDRALVISDGSNTTIRFLKYFHRADIAGPAAFSQLQGRTFVKVGFVWTCVGWLSRRYGPTLVWGLQRQ